MVFERKVGWALLGFSSLVAVLCVVVYAHFWLSSQEAPSDAGRRWAMTALKAACQGAAFTQPPASLRTYMAAAPVVVELWHDGSPSEAEVGTRDLLPSIEAVAERLRAAPGKCGDSAGGVHFTVTIPLGEGPLLRAVPLLSALSLVPLKEGLFVEAGGERVVLSPHAIWAKGVVDEGVSTPIPDLTFGMDVEALVDELMARLGAKGADGPVRIGRFSAVTWTESPYPKSRFDPRAQVTPENLREAARDGVRFLLRHQRSDGRFTYVYDGHGDRRQSGRGYNLPRHAGTAFFLAQAARISGDAQAAAGARRALRFLRHRAMTTCGPSDHLCVDEGRVSRLGATALAALASAELLRSQESPLDLAMLRGLLSHIRAMQRPDGELMHDFDHRSGKAVDVQRMYYSGEAALALLTAHRVLDDPRDLATVQRLMTHLTGSGWDFFGSRYFYGEEHWTCQAVAEADRHFHDPEALDFCLRWAGFQRTVQYGSTETPWDAGGAYGVGPLFLPRVTAIAARVEAAVPLYRQAHARGMPSAALRTQIEASLGALLRYRWAPGPIHVLKNPIAAHGGLPATLASFKVRNDFVQHAGSAMLAWTAVLTETAP